MSGLRTPLARARGLGSSHHGTGHFIAQRASAIALIPLTIWFLASLVAQAGASHEEMVNYLRDPISSVLMVLFILAAFYHMRLGVQVVIEDYIERHITRVALLLLSNFLAIAVGAVSILAVLRISLASYTG